MMESFEKKKVIYEFGKFVLDPEERRLTAGGEEIRLPAKEFDTLLLLVTHNGHALSKQEMLSAIWSDAVVEEGNLAKQISQLRKVIGSNGDVSIETVPKHGYRFKADLKLSEVDVGQPLVLEKHTVKRVKISVESDNAAPTVPMLPAGSSFSRNLWIPVLLFGIVGSVLLAGIYFRKSFVESALKVDPYAPVRLTDNPNDDTGPQWTRDGRIKFSRIYSDRHSETWIMNADGSEQTLIKDPEGKQIINQSPDGKKTIYLRSNEPGKYYLANIDGTGETLLPSHGGEWSTDSKMLVYMQRVTGENFDIFTYAVDTGKVTNVTNSPAFDADPSFSPDGKQILFDSDRDGNQEIYAVNIDGTSLRRLTFDPAGDNHPAFSPDGTQIVFTSGRDSENADVFIMNADGSDPINITKWDKSNETAGVGSWSPDGTKIAFFSDRNGGHDDIYVVSAETNRPKVILADPDDDLRSPSYSPDGLKILYNRELPNKSGEICILDVQSGSSRMVRKTELSYVAPRWSPDGSKIAFFDRLDGNSEIFAVKPDGSGLDRLTNDPAADIGPVWSPDGGQILFQSGRGEPVGKPQLYLMNSDGSGQHPITSRKGWEGDPTWAPDGRNVLFACDREDSPGNMLDICEIGTDGKNERRVLFHPEHDGHPAVSPDGKRIVFVASSDGNQELYLMNRDGSDLLRLTRDPADDNSPEWSPDGKKIIFCSNRGGKFAIYEIEITF